MASIVCSSSYGGNGRLDDFFEFDLETKKWNQVFILFIHFRICCVLSFKVFIVVMYLMIDPGPGLIETNIYVSLPTHTLGF
jgi:hypothetical protein